MLDKTLLGPCNYYCGNCAVFKNSKCLACAKATEKAEAEGRVFCNISLCVGSRNLVSYSDCKSYLCEKYDDGTFAESFIKYIRGKLKRH